MSNPFRRTRAPRSRPRLESLESRLVPTTRLFLDFGEGFPAAGLPITQAQLVGDFASGGIQGPVSIPSLTYTSLRQDIVGVIDYNEDGVADDQDYLDLKADVISIVARVYEPFNILVEEAASSSVADIQAAMQANNGDPVSSGIRDGYVIIGTAVDSGGNSIGGGGLLGIAGVDTKFFFGPQVTQTNDKDNTTLVFSDTIIGFVSNSNELATLLAFTIAHEAGHSFTLFHLSPFDFFLTPAPDTELLVGSEVMIGAYTGVQQNYIPQLSRIPLSLGDFQFDVDFTQNPYGVLADHARTGIGAKADPTLIGPGLPNTTGVGADYVTGTGANDVIRISQTGPTTASVSVTPFVNTSFSIVADLPNNPSSSYTYTINTTAGVVIDGGIGNDRIILEGYLGPNVTVRGMGGTDSLVIDGKGAGSAIYTPDGDERISFDGQADRRATITVGGMTVRVQEFEPTSRITLQGFASATFQPGGDGVDTVELANTGTTLTVRGKIDDGLDFIPFSAVGVSAFRLDLGAFETDSSFGDDVVTFRNTLTAPGLQNVEILGGHGADTLRILHGTLDLPATGGGGAFHGGAGGDVVEVLAGDLAVGEGETFRFIGGAGNDVMDLGQALLLVPFTGLLHIDGGADDDSVVLGTSNVAGVRFDGGDGNDSLTLQSSLFIQPGGKFVFDAGLGDDTMLLGGAVTRGRNTEFSYLAGAGDDTVGSVGFVRRTWTIGAQTVTMDNQYLFQAVENVLGGVGTDVFVMTRDSDLSGVLDGGAGADVVTYVSVPNVRVVLTPSTTTAGFLAEAAGGGVNLPRADNIDQIIGGGGLDDVVTSANAAGRWVVGPTGAALSSGASRLTITGFEVLNGGDFDDALVIDVTLRRVGGVAKGAGAGRIDLASSGFRQRLVFNGGLGNDSARMVGTNAAETFSLGANTVAVGGRTLTIAAVELLELLAGGGNDRVSLLAAAYAAARIDVYGQAGSDSIAVTPSTTSLIRAFGDGFGTASSGDELRLLGTAAGQVAARPPAGLTSGTLLFNNARRPVEFFGIERFFGTSGGGGGTQFLPPL